VFARFREQACTFICPYGRFQSVLLDEHSIVVAYDYKRGERRGRWRRESGLWRVRVIWTNGGVEYEETGDFILRGYGEDPAR